MKIKRFLVFIVMAMLLVLPIKANAASYSLSYEESQDSDGNTLVTVKGAQTDHTSYSFTVDMTLNNMELIDAQGSGNWTITVSGTTLTFTSNTPETSSEFTLGTLKFKKVNAAEKCDVLFTCNGETKKVTPDKPVTNPKTGNVLPYAVIVSGLVIAGTVYYVTRKNTKLYKI